MGYYDVLRQRVNVLGEDSITLLSKAGMVSWDDAEPAAKLVAQYIRLEPGSRLLLLESGAGALAVWAARQGVEVHCYDQTLLGSRLTRKTAVANDVQGVTVYEAALPLDQPPECFDAALVLVPKGRAYIDLLMRAAYRVLKPEGRFYLAGPNKGGIKSAAKDAVALFGSSVVLGYKARNRVVMAAKGRERGGENEPQYSPALLDRNGPELYSLPGVFSADAVDDGTAMLLAHLAEQGCEDRRVLDMGCGYGALGLQAAALGALKVDMVDINWLALECAQLGIDANGFENCRVWASDIYSDFEDQRYDLILANPPFHVRHRVELDPAREFIAGAWDRLDRGGRLWIVANRFIPYDAIMRETFGDGSVSILVEDTRYRILEGRR